MPVVVTIGVISLVGAAFMIRAALAVGFGIFVVPIVLGELVFLGAVYLIWLALRDREDRSEPVRTAVPRAGRDPDYAPSRRPARPATQHRLPGRSLAGRTGG